MMSWGTAGRIFVTVLMVSLCPYEPAKFPLK